MKNILSSKEHEAWIRMDETYVYPDCSYYDVVDFGNPLKVEAYKILYRPDTNEGFIFKSNYDSMTDKLTNVNGSPISFHVYPFQPELTRELDLTNSEKFRELSGKIFEQIKFCYEAEL